MGLRTLLARRLREHPAALFAVAATVLLSLVVVGTLQLFAAVIADSSVQGTVENTSLTERTIAVNAPLRAGELDQRRAAVTKAAAGIPGASTNEISVAVSRGLEGGNENDRIQLADVPAIAQVATLVDGAWPVAGSPTQIVVHEGATTGLKWKVGTKARLTSLVAGDAKPMDVVVVGVYRPKNVNDAIWLDAPLAAAGVSISDFTQYGPMVVAPNAFNGDLGNGSTVYYRIDVPPHGLTTQSLPQLQSAVDQAIGLLKDPAYLPGSQLSTKLPDTLIAAGDVGKRTTVALLTPTILLLLLGGSALALATVELAGLRDAETRLLRSRGASGRQLLLLAGVEAILVVGGCVLAAGLIAPLVAKPLALATDLDVTSLGYTSALTTPTLWTPMLIAAALAFGVVVVASSRAGQLRTDRAGAGRGRVAGTLASSGLDIGILLLAVVGVLQLRRYADSGAPKIDLLTLTAPALVIGGLAVLALRLIPILARLGSRLVSRTSGMPLAWGGWQVARRLGGQSGAILLVLLAMPMGALAIGHSATVSRALVDQSAFEVGAPLRVNVTVPMVSDPTTGGTIAKLAGTDPTAVLRSGVEVGNVQGVTALTLDSRSAAKLPPPRADLLGGHSWASSMQALSDGSENFGIPIPGTPHALTVNVGTTTAWTGNPADIDVILQDANGQWSRRRLGTVNPGDDPVNLRLELGTAQNPERYPLRLIGFIATLQFPVGGGSETKLTLTIAKVDADGTAVEVPKVWPTITDGQFIASIAPTPPLKAIPVLITPDLAKAVSLPKSGDLNVVLPSGPAVVHVVGMIDALPTATNPRLGMVIDLARLQMGQTLAPAAQQDRVTVLAPREWWLAPADKSAATAALTSASGLVDSILDPDKVLQERENGSVNAGMRGAMRLVTASALLLAALGFASTTAALSAGRRHDSAILAALGMPTGTIRRVLVLERVVVVILTAIPGIIAGAVSSWLIVPLLVGGDGHPQMPPVIVDLNYLGLALLTLGVVLALALVAAAVVSRSNKDVTGTLRAGDRE